MKNKFYLPILFVFVFAGSSFAQNGCAAALALTPGTQQCGNSAGNAGDFPANTTAPLNPCDSWYNDDEYWFSFTGNGVDGLDLTLSSITNTYAGLFVFDACPSSSPNCVASITNGFSTSDLNVVTPALTLGQTYYIVIASWGTPDNTAFCLDALLATPPTPPVNDDCSGAIALTVNPDALCGTVTSGTVNLSTASTNPTANTCFGTPDDDVWFSFVATSTAHDLDLLNIAGSTTDMYHSVYEAGAGCPGLGTEIICNDANSSVLTPLIIGNTYYVRVYTWTSTTGQNSTFDVCIGTPPSPPSNDEPCTATALTVGSSCSFSTYTNASATNSSLTVGVTLPTCSFFSGGDVWFTVTVPASGHLIFDTNTGDILDSGMEIYRGTCSTLTAIDCDDDDSFNGSMSMIDQNTLVPGETIWIRIWEYGGDNNGTFDICVYEGGGSSSGPCAGGAGGQTCGQIQPICTDSTYCYTAGIGSVASSGNNYGCLITQPNPSWYYFEISVAGTLIFDMSAISDIDFAVWGPYANLAAANAACGALPAPVDCSYSISPTEQATIPGVSVGQVYILVVTNFASVVQDIAIAVAGGNTATTNCSIVNPSPCNADAGNW